MGLRFCDAYINTGSKLITNYELDKNYPEWKVSEATKKTGVSQRWLLNDNEDIYTLTQDTFEKYFQSTKTLPADIEALIVVTQSFDQRSPGLSSEIHQKFNLSKCTFILDINEACGGFVKALVIANAVMRTSEIRSVHILCIDTYSRFTNPSDRSVRLLFSDAASITKVKNTKNKSRGIIKISSGLDSSNVDYLKINRSSLNSSNDEFFMDGAKTLMQVIRTIPSSVREVLLDYNIQDVKYFLFHQASQVVLESLEKNLNIKKEKILTNLNHYGNLGSSSIPSLLLLGYKNKLFGSNDLIVLSSFGIGFSWTTCLVRL